MDLLFHGVTGAVISKAITGEIHPEIICGAMLPDIAMFTYTASV